MSNETIAQALYDRWNARDFAGVKDLYAHDAVMDVPGTGERFVGADEVLASDQGWATAFPDGRIAVQRVTSAGDTVVVEFLGHGTNTGPIPSPDGEIPATGRSLELALCDVLTIKDGHITEVKEYYDSASMLNQLGLAGAPS